MTMTIMIWHSDKDGCIQFLIFIILKQDDRFICKIGCVLLLLVYVIYSGNRKCQQKDHVKQVRGFKS